MINLDSNTMKWVCIVAMVIGMLMLIMRSDLQTMILGAMICLGTIYNKYDKLDVIK